MLKANMFGMEVIPSEQPNGRSFAQAAFQSHSSAIGEVESMLMEAEFDTVALLSTMCHTSSVLFER